MEFKFVLGIESAETESQLPKEQQVRWPLDSLVMYCLEDGKIIGRVAAMSLKIFEGTWVDPNAPPTTAYRMIKQMETAYAAFLGDSVGAFVADEQPEIGDYLTRIGYEKLPVTFYTKDLTVKKEET